MVASLAERKAVQKVDYSVELMVASLVGEKVDLMVALRVSS